MIFLAIALAASELLFSLYISKKFEHHCQTSVVIILSKNRLSSLNKKIMPTYGDNESSDDDDEEVIPMEVRKPRPQKPVPDADGWTTVATRRRRK